MMAVYDLALIVGIFCVLVVWHVVGGTMTQMNVKGSLMTFINPYLTNGFSNHYHLGESTFVFRSIRCDFFFFFFFFSIFR